MLVDGRFLATQLVATGDLNVLGRVLDAEEIQSLDAYIRRCKLGRFTPFKANVMEHQARTNEDVARELAEYREAARQHLRKLRNIKKAVKKRDKRNKSRTNGGAAGR